jgi:hypothetical protein
LYTSCKKRDYKFCAAPLTHDSRHGSLPRPNSRIELRA